MTRLIAEQLRRRARSHGSDPLVTYYDLGSGARTELSGVSFLNWVDKTSNLLVDELLLDPGAVIDLTLARSAPGHWVTLVLELAAWQVGATVRVCETPRPADLLVLGPDWADHDRSQAEAVLACSLHPLGLGMPTALPAEVADFSLEVRGQSDFHSAAPRLGSEIAWVDDHQQLTQADLVGVDTILGRRLVQPDSAWSSVRDALLRPVLSGGSSVVVVGDDPERLQRIIETERVDTD